MAFNRLCELYPTWTSCIMLLNHMRDLFVSFILKWPLVKAEWAGDCDSAQWTHSIWNVILFAQCAITLYERISVFVFQCGLLYDDPSICRPAIELCSIFCPTSAVLDYYSQRHCYADRETFKTLFFCLKGNSTVACITKEFIHMGKKGM